MIGLPENSGVQSKKIQAILLIKGKCWKIFVLGQKITELNPQGKHAVIASSDIPSITGEMVDWAVKQLCRAIMTFITMSSNEVLWRTVSPPPGAPTHI